MPKTTNLRALLINELRELFYAEKQLVKAIPKLAAAAKDIQLKAALRGHLAQTRGHVKRLHDAFKILGVAPQTKTCHPLASLVQRGSEAAHIAGRPELRDADIIGAAQGVEHFEMAAYGTARSFAEALDEFEVVMLLQATLEEEEGANKLLARISLDVNRSALTAA